MLQLRDLVDHLAPVVRIEHAIRSRWCQDSWRYDANDAGRIVKWIDLARPRMVVETGTFEAQGTFLIASAMQACGGGTLFTFDMPNDPDNLSITEAQWAELARIRAENLRVVQGGNPAVATTYVDGNTRVTLPATAFPAPVDFWFQDTMHFLGGILAEFNAMEERMAPGGVIVFDDIGTEHPLRAWMAENRNEGWFHHHFAGGHGQLWSQKL